MGEEFLPAAFLAPFDDSVRGGLIDDGRGVIPQQPDHADPGFPGLCFFTRLAVKISADKNLIETSGRGAVKACAEEAFFIAAAVGVGNHGHAGAAQIENRMAVGRVPEAVEGELVVKIEHGDISFMEQILLSLNFLSSCRLDDLTKAPVSQWPPSNYLD